MLAARAPQRCPPAHSHSSGEWVLTYSVDSSLPPRRFASRRNNCKVNFCVPAQVGHHVPYLINAGLASHSCPSAHRHLSLIELLTEVRDRHWPPRSAANCRISSIVKRAGLPLFRLGQ